RSVRVIMIFALIGMIGWGGYLGAKHIFIDNEEYRLQEIKLETNGHINHARVVEVTGIDLEASIFAIDTDHVRDRMTELPEVTHCEVERRLPGTLQVTLTERKPIAWLQSAQFGFPGKSEDGVLVDEDGVTFPCEGSLWRTSQDLPTVMVKDSAGDAFSHGKKMRHAEVTRALHLVQTFSKGDVRADWLPDKIIILNDYSMQVICNDGSRAVFGMYDHERQLGDYITVHEHALKTRRVIEHINLIPQKNIPVKFGGEPILVKPRKVPKPSNPHERDIESILDRN
ncbi:MAG: cell division protein FtsQ/DivIB, partial [Akkermansiaceae bacterium]